MRPITTRIAPPATQTQRLRTPVTPTSPTFCENDVQGTVLNNPPPTMSGTATAPAYITSTCCRPSGTSRLAGQHLVDGRDLWR